SEGASHDRRNPSSCIRRPLGTESCVLGTYLGPSLSRSQIKAVASRPAVTARLPSAEIERDITLSSWPSIGGSSSRPVAASHTRRYLSSLTERTRRPSGV